MNRPVPWLLGLGTFLYLLWMLAPGIFWLDSAEFVTTAARATVPHPPGSPLFVLLGHQAGLLPLGSLALRVNLLSAAFGGLAMGLLAACADRVLLLAGARNALTLGLSVLLLALLPLSEAFWYNAVRAEVYTLQFSLGLGLVLAGLAGVGASGETRGRLRALVAFLAGLGFCNHYYLTALVLPVPLLLLWLRRDEGLPPDQDLAPPAPRPGTRIDGGPRALLLAPLPWFLLGLLPLLFLPLRAAVPGDFAWADTGSLKGFFELLSAKAFHLSLTEMPVAPLPEAILRVLASWFGLLSPLLVFAGFLGIAGLLLLQFQGGLALCLLLLGGLLAKAVMYLDTENPDDHAYMMMGLQALVLGAVALVAVLYRLLAARPSRLFRVLAALPLLLVLLAALWGALGAQRQACQRQGLTGFFAPDVLNRQLLGRLPPEAVFLPSYYPLFFNHVYYQEVEGRRPEVTLLHQSFFSRISQGAPYTTMKRQTAPDLAPVLDAWDKDRLFPLEELQALKRKVILEAEVLTAPELPEGLAPGGEGLELPWKQTWFAGSGLGLASYQVNLDNGATVGMLSRFWAGLYREVKAQGRLHPELRKLLAWLHFRDAMYFLNRGQFKEAILEARLLATLFPKEQRFQRLLAFASAKDPSFKLDPEPPPEKKAE